MHGTTYNVSDYWCTKERDAWWKAIKYAELAEMEEQSLHERCSAARLGRLQWTIFLQHVTPWQPQVPRLPVD
jgi:hypothetical protein